MYPQKMRFKKKNDCFQAGVELEIGSNVTILIGKNNSGKSKFLDRIKSVTRDVEGNNYSEEEYVLKVEESVCDHARRILQNFPHSQNLVLEAAIGSEWIGLRGKDGLKWMAVSDAEKLDYFSQVLNRLGVVGLPFTGRNVATIEAWRNIVPESVGATSLSPSGAGATSLIVRYLTQKGNEIDLVRTKVRDGLNRVLGPDGHVLSICPQHNPADDMWEIYLEEEKKGFVPLSASGAGLHTVLLVMLWLYVVPDTYADKSRAQICLFEELENNLHPDMLRRLLQVIEEYAEETKSFVFLATHSSVVLDMFYGKKNAQIIHVEHDGEKATTRRVDKWMKCAEVLDDLGARASDLLQSNGLVWLEGPSDRIYFNKWIELTVGDKLREGRDYQCVFYGGSNIASHGADDPWECSDDLVNLLSVNRNAIVICDGDRLSEQDAYKPGPLRMRESLKDNPNALVWITGAKEVENYVPAQAFERQRRETGFPQINQFEPFFMSDPLRGYYVDRTGNKTFKKVDFAKTVINELRVKELAVTFEWQEKMQAICELICKWNGMGSASVYTEEFAALCQPVS